MAVLNIVSPAVYLNRKCAHKGQKIGSVPVKMISFSVVMPGWEEGGGGSLVASVYTKEKLVPHPKNLHHQQPQLIEDKER